MAELSDDGVFDKQSTRFIEWLKQSGTNINPKVELADLQDRSAGRGVLAKEDIAEDEELFSIPRTSILTVDNSSLPEQVRKDVKLHDPWLSLILAMIYEYQLGSASRWEAYFDVLPETFDTLMFWSDEELKELQGSAVLNKIGKQSADDTIREHVIPLIRHHASAFSATELGEEETLALYHRMGSTIMAYAFDLGSPNTEEDGWEEDSASGQVSLKGMVPLADMLNADADCNNAKLFYEDDKVVMKAIRPVSKGEELINDYGPLPRADVLRRYGYVTDNYAKFDVVEVSLDLIKESAKAQPKTPESEIEARLQWLEDSNWLDDGYDISLPTNQDGQFPEELTEVLSLLSMPSSEFDKFKKKGKVPNPDPSEEAVQLLYDILKRRRALYPSDHTPSNLEAPGPVEFQNGCMTSNDRDRRQTMALQVINGEKQVLRVAAVAALKLLSDLSDRKRKADTLEGDAKDRQKSSKRQK